MSKRELMNMVGGFLSSGMDWDTCLQVDEHNPYDDEASECADKFGALRENGMNPYEAFVRAFFEPSI